MRKWKPAFAVVTLVASLFSISLATPGWASPKKAKPTISTKRDPARESERIQREVRHELTMLPYYSVFDYISFKVEGDRVELIGQVSRPTLKTDAERAVKSIEAVESITNNLEVLPLSPNDDRIRVAVYRAIYGNEVLQMYGMRAVPPIHIIVKNGNVTLEGVVAREMEKNVANLQANSVPGVFSVTNRLVVEGGS